MTLATVTAQPTVAEALEPRAAVKLARTLADARAFAVPTTVLVACAWWTLAAPRLWGGRGAGAISIGAALTAISLLAVAPQRVLPRRVIGLAFAVSVGAIGVAILAPTGWAGISTAATYVSVSWTAVSVAAAVRREPRLATLLLMLIVAAALVEVAEAWLPWWGGANPAAPITGTFNWYDPFAAFLIPGAVIGLAVWLTQKSTIALLGLLGFALGSIGLVYSTSRAADACFAAAVVVVCLAHLAERRFGGLARLGVGLGVTAVAVWGIAGPPFFAHRGAPLAGAAARGASQSLGQNGGYRLDFWRTALGVFQRHPLVGGGFHSLATEARGHIPMAWPVSPLAHNGYLQALSDGGLLLAVPFLAAIVGLVWLIVRSFVSAVRDRDFSIVGFVAPLALGAMLAHSLVDFDWSYAANFALVGVLAGVVVGTRTSRRLEPVERPAAPLAAVAVLIGVTVLGVAAATSWSGDLRQSLPISQSASHGGTQ